MITATVASFRSTLPELSRFGDDAVELAIEEALYVHNIRPIATLLLAAHLLVFTEMNTGNGGLSGPTVSQTETTSQTAGPLSTSRTITSSSVTQVESGERDAFFAATSYGQRFIQLEAASPEYRFAARVIG